MKDICLEPVNVVCYYGPQNISTTKVVPFHKPSFLRILALVRQSMLERSIIITDLYKVLKIFGVVRDVSGFQE